MLHQYSTVGEMREALKNYHDDMPIVQSWNCSGFTSIGIEERMLGEYKIKLIKYDGPNHVLVIIPDTDRDEVSIAKEEVKE